MKQFLDAGVVACLNTDDPSISGIDLPHELTVAAPAAGLTPAHVELASRHAQAMAFTFDPAKLG